MYGLQVEDCLDWPTVGHHVNEGDPVLLIDGTQGTLLKLPRSEGRKRPRALVQLLSEQRWVHLDELKAIEQPQQGSQ